MSTTDDRQPKQHDYPFLADPRFDGLRDTYLGLRSFGQGMAVEELAEKLGISESTAHRRIKRLKAIGVLEAEKQFQDGRQRMNRYLFPAPDWWVEGCNSEKCQPQVEGCHDTTKGQLSEGCHDKRPGQEGCNHKSPGQEGCHGDGEGCHFDTTKAQVRRGVTLCSITTKNLDTESESESSSLPDTHQTDTKAGHSPDDPALGSAECPPVGDAQGVRFGPGSRGSTRPNILVALHQANQLVEAFESHVTRVGPVRRRKFHDTAYLMLMHDCHPLAEVLDVIEHAFAHQWRLAYEMDGAAYDYNGWDRGLTRLRQIRDFYDAILGDMMSKPSPKDDPPEPPPTDWSEPRTHLDRHVEPSPAPMPDDPAKIAELDEKETPVALNRPGPTPLTPEEVAEIQNACPEERAAIVRRLLDRHEPSPPPPQPVKIAEQALQAKLDEMEAERKRQIADRMAKAKAGYAEALAKATSDQQTDNQEGSPCR